MEKSTYPDVRGISINSSTGESARDFGLKDQIRRAAVFDHVEYRRGFRTRWDEESSNEAVEVRSQLYVALDAGYLSQTEFETLSWLTTETARLVRGFMTYLSDCDIRGSKYHRGQLNRKLKTLKPET